MSYVWLILKLLPFLLITAAVFYRRGVQSVHGEIAKIQHDKDSSIEREQKRTDETVQKLKEVEEQLAALTAQYEQLERSAVPRRKLNEAEAQNNSLMKENARLQQALGTAPAPAKPRTETPAPAPAPEIAPVTTPDIAPVTTPTPEIAPVTTPDITPAMTPETEPTAPPEPEVLTLSPGPLVKKSSTPTPKEKKTKRRR
jgi:hypothetical protein